MKHNLYDQYVIIYLLACMDYDAAYFSSASWTIVELFKFTRDRLERALDMYETWGMGS